MIPENDFIAQHPNDILVRISVPNDSSTYENLKGQLLTITISIKSSVKDLKDMISSQLSIPSNKFQLKHTLQGFLKDKLTMGYYNFDTNTDFMMSLKQRGGRK